MASSRFSLVIRSRSIIPRQDNRVINFERTKIDLFQIAKSICKVTTMVKLKESLGTLANTTIPTVEGLFTTTREQLPPPSIRPDCTDLQQLQVVCNFFLGYLICRLTNLKVFADQLLEALDDKHDTDMQLHLLSKITLTRLRPSRLESLDNERQGIYVNDIEKKKNKSSEEKVFCAIWSVLDRTEIYTEQMWKKFCQVTEAPADLKIIECNL